MHPILTEKRRLMLYLAVWLPVGLLLGALVALTGEVSWLEALALAFPLIQIYAFICLAAWYPSRATPLTQSRLFQILGGHAVAAALSSSLWQLAGALWAYLLSRLPPFASAFESYRGLIPLFFVIGLLLYFLAAAASYLYLAFEASRRAETRMLEVEKERALAAKELELARSIQRRLLPPDEHRAAGYRLAARNLAASYVAGDFYDFHVLADGSLRIAIADVSGKGIAASLITATVKAMLPLLAADRSLAETLGELNRRLEVELAEREFVALLLADYEPASGRVELVNAGLPDPYVLRRGSPARAIEVPQPRLPLGLRREMLYRSVALELAPGERLLLLTDGLPEAPSPIGEPLGYERLAGLLDHDAPTPAAWLDRLLERVGEASAGEIGRGEEVPSELADDQTVLLLEREAAG